LITIDKTIFKKISKFAGRRKSEAGRQKTDLKSPCPYRSGAGYSKGELTSVFGLLSSVLFNESLITKYLFKTKHHATSI